MVVQHIRNLSPLRNDNAAYLFRAPVGLLLLVGERLPLVEHVSVCGGGELLVVKLHIRIGGYLPHERQESLHELRGILHGEQRNIVAIAGQRVLIKNKRVHHLINAGHFICHALIDVIQTRETLEEIGD